MTEQKLKDVLWNYACNTGYMLWLSVTLREYVNDHKVTETMEEQRQERHHTDMFIKYDEPADRFWYMDENDWNEVSRDQPAFELYQF